MNKATPLFLCLGLTLLTPIASAQRNIHQAEGEVERLLEDARASYDNLELDASEASLNQAVRLGEKWGLHTPALAQVFLQRGILAHVRDKNADAAVADFVRALELDGRVRLDEAVSTPSLERLFGEARQRAQPAADVPDDRRPVSRAAEPLTHEPPRSAKSGEKLTLTVTVSEDLDRQLYRVYVYFRSARADSTQRLEFRPNGPQSFQARIPARFVAGRSVSYYIVVEDRDGRTIGGFATAREPAAVPVDGDAFGAVDRLPTGSSLGGGDDEEEDDFDLGSGGARKYVTFGVSLGTGGGFISDRAQPQNQRSAEIRPGFALAPLHALAELDFWATEWFALSAFGRIQIVEFAHLEGGRLKFRVLNRGSHQLTLRAGGGVGRVRHLVDLGTALDTTLEGPYSYTLGASYTLNFTPTWALTVTPDFYHLIGDSPSPHLDLSVGVQAGF